MREITLNEIKCAIIEGVRIDGSADIFPDSVSFKRAEELKNGSGLGRIAPFTRAAYQVSKGDDGTNALAHKHRAFELLSLAARAKAFVFNGMAGCKGSSNEDVDAMASAANALGAHLHHMPRVRVSTLISALRWAARVRANKLEVDADATNLEAGTFLQLIGCEIISDDVLRCEVISDDFYMSCPALDISALSLAIPLSFIGCVFNMPIIANTCKLGSLDISGSALYGMEANGLKVGGDFYMRRTTIISSISLSSARIRGTFDASDSLIVPFKSFHSRQIDESDHGVVNLSRIVVGNEAHLNRMRAWGGVSMRGARFGRNLYMQNALFVSPLGVLLKRATTTLVQRNGIPEISEADARYAKISKLLHAFVNNDGGENQAPQHGSSSSDRASTESPLIKIETLAGVIPSNENSALSSVLSASIRSRVTSLRADSVEINGCIFAYGALMAGRVRMKFLRASGNVEFAGAILQSGEFLRRSFNNIQKFIDKNNIKDERYKTIIGIRNNTGRGFNQVPVFFPDDFALDIRSSRVGGDVSFKFGEIADWGIFSLLAEIPMSAPQTKIHGRISITDADIGGSVILHGIKCIWSPWDFIGYDPGANLCKEHVQMKSGLTWESWRQSTQVKRSPSG